MQLQLGCVFQLSTRLRLTPGGETLNTTGQTALASAQAKAASCGFCSSAAPSQPP